MTPEEEQANMEMRALVESVGESQGCLFDLGIAFALRKTVIPIKLPEATPHKSFQNMVRRWSGVA